MAEEQLTSDAGNQGVTSESPLEPETRAGVAVSRSRGQLALHPNREQYVGVVESLRNDGFWTCVDLCVVDYLTNPHRVLPDGVVAERFEVVANLLNHSSRERIRVRVQVPADDPTIATITHVHPGVEASEREAFDLFGISFDGHPDPTRILLPDRWVGHPLRKDEPVGRIPVQFKAAPAAR